jgi:uncharacterized caspase-like protein
MKTVLDVLRIACVAALLAALAGAALAQRSLEVAAAPSTSARVALIIGNGAYKDSPLANPVNDARDIAVALSALGFAVTIRENVDQRSMKQAIREFGSALKPGGTALFFFAGHGMQVKGRNYLVPIGEDIVAEDEVEDQSVDVNLVLEKMEAAQSQVNVVILDACRNNPFQRRFRSASRGLAPLDAAKGSLVAFATAPGSVAADGTGRNGLYTKHLLDSLKHPDSGIESVFKRVRAAVIEDTRGQQVPWESSSLIGDFFFNPKAVQGAPASALAAPAQDTPLAVEIAFWQSIHGSQNPAELQAYLTRYPQGQFASVARSRLDGLKAAPAAAAPASGARATVYVLRKSKWIGSNVDYFVTNKGRMIGKLLSGSYFVHHAPPGELVLSAEGGYSVARTFEVEAGRTYYIELEHNLATVEIRMVDEADGGALVKGLKRTASGG